MQKEEVKKDTQDRYILITAVGPNRPGLMAEISSIIAEFGYNIEDLDQVVMKNIFILSMLVKIPFNASIDRLKEKMSYLCNELGLEVSFYYAGR
ncbi:MAG: ACT domain-containing protein [Candidatus Methanomethylicia archaeon]|jgi:predicted amino acid-binding ACT domain protein|nr:ACT domain-containing protein [Candidatus Methanomethylicia archaeon]MCQ5340681.1 ACT domain-containing protein [Candidatus Methanomethylicia archaeon]